MTFARRVFVLLGAYEDLTERETNAIRRGDIDHAIALENRKLRLAEALAAARKNAGLSAEEVDALNGRVRLLEIQENRNLTLLREEMARVSAGLARLDDAAQRTRRVRRGYVDGSGATAPLAGNILGRA